MNFFTPLDLKRIVYPWEKPMSCLEGALHGLVLANMVVMVYITNSVNTPEEAYKEKDNVLQIFAAGTILGLAQYILSDYLDPYAGVDDDALQRRVVLL